MNATKNGLKFGVAGLMAILFLAIGVHAGSVTLFAGQFTLPFEAHWGLADLPAGTYTVIIENSLGFHKGIIRFSDNQGRAEIVMPQQFSDFRPDQIHQADLVCVRSSGTYNVKAIEMPRIGVFYCAVHTGETSEEAKAPEVIERVPVTVKR